MSFNHISRLTWLFQRQLSVKHLNGLVISYIINYLMLFTTWLKSISPLMKPNSFISTSLFFIKYLTHILVLIIVLYSRLRNIYHHTHFNQYHDTCFTCMYIHLNSSFTEPTSNSYIFLLSLIYITYNFFLTHFSLENLLYYYHFYYII